MSLYCVALLTYNRPDDLEECLKGIAGQNFDVDSLQVLVIDNHDSLSGKKVCEELRGEIPQLEYFALGAQNIAEGRNAALDRCTRPFLLFIDDDEIPDKNWLREMDVTRNRFPSQGIVGHVQYHYSRPRSFVARTRFLNLFNPDTGTTKDVVLHTGNCLIDVEFTRQKRVRFSPAFGVTGGSDSYFFLRLIQQGGKVIWTKEAFVHTHVPPERCTLRFALKRYFRTSGNVARIVHLMFVCAPNERTLKQWSKLKRSTAAIFQLFRTREDFDTAVAVFLKDASRLLGIWLYERFGFVYKEYGNRPGLLRVTKQIRLGAK